MNEVPQDAESRARMPESAPCVKAEKTVASVPSATPYGSAVPDSSRKVMSKPFPSSVRFIVRLLPPTFASACSSIPRSGSAAGSSFQAVAKTSPAAHSRWSVSGASHRNPDLAQQDARAGRAETGPTDGSVYATRDGRGEVAHFLLPFEPSVILAVRLPIRRPYASGVTETCESAAAASPGPLQNPNSRCSRHNVAAPKSHRRFPIERV
jgi:hypothetical protein